MKKYPKVKRIDRENFGCMAYSIQAVFNTKTVKMTVENFVKFCLEQKQCGTYAGKQRYRRPYHTAFNLVHWNRNGDWIRKGATEKLYDMASDYYKDNYTEDDIYAVAMALYSDGVLH